MRRWLRFRLKHVMILVAVIALSVTCIAWMGDFGRHRWIERIQRPDYKLLLTTETQGHSVAFFEDDDEQLVFVFKRLSGKTSHSATFRILDTDGNDLLATDAERTLGYSLHNEGSIRALTDELMGNSPIGYHYPIRRGHQGELRFEYSWDYVDEKRDIILDVTVPWRTDDAL